MIDVPKCSNLLQSTSVTHYKLKEFHYTVNMPSSRVISTKLLKSFSAIKKKSMKLRTYLFLYIRPYQLQHGQQDWKHFTSIHIDEVENLPLLVHSASPSTAWTARFGSISLASISRRQTRKCQYDEYKKHNWLHKRPCSSEIRLIGKSDCCWRWKYSLHQQDGLAIWRIFSKLKCQR